MNAPKSFRAILSRTTTDIVKSKILSPELSQITLDVYMNPTEYAKLLEEYYDQEFQLTISRQKFTN